MLHRAGKEDSTGQGQAGTNSVLLIFFASSYNTTLRYVQM